MNYSTIYNVYHSLNCVLFYIWVLKLPWRSCPYRNTQTEIYHKTAFFFPDCICLAIAKVSFLHLSLLLTSVLITSHGVAWVAGQRPVWPQKQAILHPLHGPRGPQHFTLQQSRGSSPHGHVPRLGPERLLPTHACTGQKGESDSDERVETTIKCILSIQRILYCNEFSWVLTWLQDGALDPIITTAAVPCTCYLINWVLI